MKKGSEVICGVAGLNVAFKQRLHLICAMYMYQNEDWAVGFYTHLQGMYASFFERARAPRYFLLAKGHPIRKL